MRCAGDQSPWAVRREPPRLRDGHRGPRRQPSRPPCRQPARSPPLRYRGAIRTGSDRPVTCRRAPRPARPPRRRCGAAPSSSTRRLSRARCCRGRRPAHRRVRCLRHEERGAPLAPFVVLQSIACRRRPLPQLAWRRMCSSKVSPLTSARRRPWEAAIFARGARAVEPTRTVRLGVCNSSPFRRSAVPPRDATARRSSWRWEGRRRASGQARFGPTARVGRHDHRRRDGRRR